MFESFCCCVQGGKQDSFQQWEVVPIEVCDVRQVKNSFKKLMKACVPSSSTSDPNMSFQRCLEDSEWMALVSALSGTFTVRSPFVTFSVHFNSHCVCVCIRVSSYTGCCRCPSWWWSFWTRARRSWSAWRTAGTSPLRFE